MEVEAGGFLSQYLKGDPLWLQQPAGLRLAENAKVARMADASFREESKTC